MQRMEVPKYELCGVRVGGDRVGESFLSDGLLMSPYAMPSAGFTFPSFLTGPLDCPTLAPSDDPFSVLNAPDSPASTHSASTFPADPLSPDHKSFCEPEPDLGAVDLEALGLSFEFPLLSALDSAFPLSAHVTIENVYVQPTYEYTSLQPQAQAQAATPAPSFSAQSDNEFSASSCASDDPADILGDIMPQDVYEIVRSLGEAVPPPELPAVDTLAHVGGLGASQDLLFSPSAMATVEATSVASVPPLEAVAVAPPIQAAQPTGFGSVIVPNNLRAALPKNSTESVPSVPTAFVLTQQQLKELNLPDDTLIVLQSDGQLVIDLASNNVTLQPLNQSQPIAASVPTPTPTQTRDVFVPQLSAARPQNLKAAAARQHVIASSLSLGTASASAPRYQERAALKRVRARDASESDKSDASDPTWTPDDELDYAAARPKRMAVRRFPNLNLNLEDDVDYVDYDVDEERHEYDVDASWLKPASVSASSASSPTRSSQKAGAKEETKSTSSGASGRKSQAAPQNRKERKRQQNREAAARYREKKRAEHEDVEESIDEIEARNVQLRASVERARRECEAFKRAARQVLGPSFDRLFAEARAKAAASPSARSSSSHILVHRSKH